jgi:hypothetical protein
MSVLDMSLVHGLDYLKNLKIMDNKTKLEGRITDIQIGNICNLHVNGLPPEIPQINYLKFYIKPDSKKVEWVEMPIDFGHKSNLQLIRGSLIGERALYVQEVLQRPDRRIRFTRTLTIKSGKYNGLKYDFLFQ